MRRTDARLTGKALAAIITDARNDQLADKMVLSWNTYSSRSIVQT